MRLQNGNVEKKLMNERQCGQPQQPSHDIKEREREKDLSMYRSGSAPPTVEGSYNAISNLFRNLDFPNGGMSEEEMRSHPAYLSYYYSHDNINPRLPPPLLSKEEWRVHQRLRSGGLPFGEIMPTDWRKRGMLDDHGHDIESSLFSVQPADSMHKQNPTSLINMSNPPCHASSLWLLDTDRDFTLTEGARLGGLALRRKSFANILLVSQLIVCYQNDIYYDTNEVYHLLFI